MAGEKTGKDIHGSERTGNVSESLTDNRQANTIREEPYYPIEKPIRQESKPAEQIGGGGAK